MIALIDLYCGSCKETKPTDQFSFDPSAKIRQGCAYHCKLCAATNARRHHKWRMLTDPNYRQAKKSAYINHKYGISLKEYEALLERQQSRCAICRMDVVSGKAHYDHCHKTGKFRAFLCVNCNQGLGSFKDNPALLADAIDYLHSHNSGVAAVKEGS